MSDHNSRSFILITIAVLALGVGWSHHNKSSVPLKSRWISLVTYPECRPQHRVFGDLAEFVDIFHMSLDSHGKSEVLVAGAVEANFFQLIGVEPVLGRAFEADEDQGDHVVMLSNRFWHKHFRGAANAVGRTITLDGETYQVVGVLPPDFVWNNRETDVWMPSNPVVDPNGIESEI